MHFLNIPIFSFIFSIFVLSLGASEFELPLAVTNSQVGQLIIGCKHGATGGFDKGQDIVVPPMGMDCGIVGIQMPESSIDMLYKDIRNPESPQTWRIHCRPGAKAIQISWTANGIPDDMAFTIQPPGGKPADMRTFTRILVTSPGTVVITATPAQKTAKH